MKPLKFGLRILIPCAVALPAVVCALAPDEFQGDSVDHLLAALPAPGSDRIWVKVREKISVEELSGSLKVEEEQLAKLNDVNEDHSFTRGDWLVVPSQQGRQLMQIASIDPNDLRRTPPMQALPPVQDAALVRFGDTLAKISQRYGLTLQELLRLNPGLETARLVVGSQVRLAQSAPGRTRLLLGLKPTASGGISWPELPGFEGPTNPFEGPASPHGWIWPTKGVFSSGFGWRWGRMHKGIDVANNVGTPIVAAKAGRVAFAGWHDGGYGYLVTLAHADGSRSLYAHNSRLMVQEGQDVEQGAVISQMGSTGRSTGPHLHFEIHPADAGAVNPLQLLPPRA